MTAMSPGLPGPGIDLSLGEVQSLAVKAARGAGRAVGVAEDAGRATRWLWARGIDGTQALAGLLQATDGRTAAEIAPALPDLTPVRMAICPLALGGYLSDVGMIPQGSLGPVWAPDLVLPFMADVAPEGVDIVAEQPDVSGPVRIRLTVRDAPRAVVQSRALVPSDTLNILLDFAARTYAPATEESRARGAGAGPSESD